MLYLPARIHESFRTMASGLLRKVPHEVAIPTILNELDKSGMVRRAPNLDRLGGCCTTIPYAKLALDNASSRALCAHKMDLSDVAKFRSRYGLARAWPIGRLAATSARHLHGGTSSAHLDTHRPL